MQSRYYNPELGRFISADDPAYLGANGGISAYNLFAYCGNNPYRITYGSSGISKCAISGTANQSIIGIAFLQTSNLHWKNESFSTDFPSLFVFSQTKGALVDWGASVYKGSIFFDNAENHSIYIGFGNVSAFAGYNIAENKYGIFADAYLFNLGYDGKYIDASVSIVGVGIILGWENNTFRAKLDLPGLPGVDISINFGAIIKDIFG